LKKTFCDTHSGEDRQRDRGGLGKEKSIPGVGVVAGGGGGKDRGGPPNTRIINPGWGGRVPILKVKGKEHN